MTQAFDLIVLGAGPAGCHAACAAARHGLSVALIDEAVAAGGQVYRAPAPGHSAGSAKLAPDSIAGETLRTALDAAQVRTFFGRRAWAVTRGFAVDTAGPDRHETFGAARLIAATGTYERVVPFPGWTLPGVIGLAAATILIKSQGMVPGRRVVVAGCGPLLVAVAAKIAASGAELAAVVDLAGRSDWISAVPALARRPDLLRRGIGWALRLGQARVPIYFRHTVISADGTDRVERVSLAPVDGAGAPVAGAHITLDTDALVIGHGLVPGAEVPRLLRASMSYEPLRGGWIPKVDTYGRTSIDGLYAIGDGAGIRGAEPAALAGKIVGITAAHDAGSIDQYGLTALVRPLNRQRSSYAAFADASAAFMALRPAQVRAIEAQTIVCRCEDVTRASIDAAARDGAADVNQLKHFTRCGMGPCQGRMCGDVAAELLAQARGVSRKAVGYWTGRPPLRPVPLADLVGAFDYADIPIPKPAPL